jgi:hypothetical protein
MATHRLRVFQTMVIYVRKKLLQASTTALFRLCTKLDVVKLHKQMHLSAISASKRSVEDDFGVLKKYQKWRS